MCLVTFQRKPKILKKDLRVYKAVIMYDDEIHSTYYDFTWEKGKLYTEKLLIEKFPFKSVEHYDSIVFDHYNTTSKYKLTCISDGFHAALNEQRLKNSPYDIMEFLIPKGSEVYYDATGLVVSNQMMLLDE